MINIKLEYRRNRTPEEFEELTTLFPSIIRLVPQLSSTARDLTPSDVVRILNQEDCYTALAVDGNPFEGPKVVGMATLFIKRKYTGVSGYIEDVVVDEGCRGQGIGKQLILKLIELANGRSVKYIELTSAPERKEARKLYKKLGFVKRKTNVFRKIL